MPSSKELHTLMSLQVALTFTVVALTSIVLFFAGQISLYTPEQRRE